ncbi:unnamed protein product [Caenorhabditis bovis]|uniref:Uncharacterized protein n=1 Tax=Caenorhabditis bovis TaxID=2654633 RepID=A0A8S1EFN1_9PELO|nr:unnamed protein product [Caenorhabditis bovis]
MLKLLVLVLALAICANALLGAIGSKQTATVTGKFVCNGQPVKDVLVKLYEDGTIMDSKLASAKTAADGSFTLTGSQNKIRKLDPKINVYHRCNWKGACSKKVTIHVPKNAVSKGGKQGQVFDIGVLNLANRFPGESSDCIH